MSEVLIFGGTTEGRLLAEFCAAKGIRAAVSVTTDYGAELLPRSYFIRELVGNLDSSQMSFLLKTDDFLFQPLHDFLLQAGNIRL